MKAFCILLFVTLTACLPAKEDIASLASKQFRESNVNEESWLHDGNLHFSSALEWQKSSFQNKRATASDFLLALNEQGRLKIDISDNKSLKTHSEKLAKQLNVQFRIIGPTVENTKKYEKKMVSEVIVRLASQNGWLQNV